MSRLNEFELRVCNKEICELNFEEVYEIFSDCLFLGVDTELDKLADIVHAIAQLPKDEQELAWTSAKIIAKDVFNKATVQLAPRFHICENIGKDGDKELENEIFGETEPEEDEEPQSEPVKRKTLSKK